MGHTKPPTPTETNNALAKSIVLGKKIQSAQHVILLDSQ